MCELETMRELYNRGQITLEAFAIYQEKAEWRMYSDSHRKRLVCSPKCFEEMMIVVGDAEALKKCGNKKCKHSAKLHTAESGYCTASRCKCYKFETEISTEEQTQLDIKALEQNPELQNLIEGAKKL